MDRGDYNIPFAFLKKHGDNDQTAQILGLDVLLLFTCYKIRFFAMKPIYKKLNGKPYFLKRNLSIFNFCFLHATKPSFLTMGPILYTGFMRYI